MEGFIKRIQTFTLSFFEKVIFLLLINAFFQVFAIFNTIAYGAGAFVLHNDYKNTPPELQWWHFFVEICHLQWNSAWKNLISTLYFTSLNSAGTVLYFHKKISLSPNFNSDFCAIIKNIIWINSKHFMHWNAIKLN